MAGLGKPNGRKGVGDLFANGIAQVSLGTPVYVGINVTLIGVIGV